MGIRTRHTVSGAIEENTPEHIFEHPVFGRYLEAVGPDAKPFNPILHKPKTVEVEAKKSDYEDAKPPAAEPAKTAPTKKNSKD